MKHFRFILTVLAVLTLQAARISAQGLPSGQPSSSQIIGHLGFTLSYNETLRIPDWVAWELTAQEAAAKEASRTDEFLPDPDVRGYCPDTWQYSRSGFDRGHMAPAADMKWSLKAMEESFYLSNVCPQDRELNAGLWCELEQRCRVYARMFGKLQIVTGPLVGESPRTIGSEHVTVPGAFFKALLAERGGECFCIGFIMPNSPLDRAEDIFSYAVSVSDIEKASGLRLWPEMKDPSAKDTVSKEEFDIKWTKR